MQYSKFLQSLTDELRQHLEQKLDLLDCKELPNNGRNPIMLLNFLIDGQKKSYS